MTAHKWEVRIDNYRMAGDTYPTWKAAMGAAEARINTLYHEAARSSPELLDKVGRAQSDFWDVQRRLSHETPRASIAVYVPTLGPKMRKIEVNRIPY